MPGRYGALRFVEGNPQGILVDLFRYGGLLFLAVAHFRGAAQGFAILRGLVEDHWEHVHPQLDPDDDDDPTMRFNILGDLSSEQSSVLACVRKIPIVSVRGLGSFGLRDLALATGERAPAEGETAPSLAMVNGAFLETKAEDLVPVGADAASCVESIRRIERVLRERSAGALPPDLVPLRTLFEQAAFAVQSRLAARGEGTDQGAETDGSSDEGCETSATGGISAKEQKGPRPDPSRINSREDVVSAIDRICEYYANKEPTSPVPLLLGRCKRWVHKDFMGIIRDMVPDSLGQVEMLRGPMEEEDSYS